MAEGFDSEQRAALEAPLDPGAVRQRQGQGGATLDYIEGWRAMAHANRVFGHEGWDRETLELRQLAVSETHDRDGRPQQAVTYLATVRVTVRAGEVVVIREGTGCGTGYALLERPGEAHESAVKEAETDATKRALVTFGAQFGLELYGPQQRGRQASPASASRTPTTTPGRRYEELEQTLESAPARQPNGSAGRRQPVRR